VEIFFARRKTVPVLNARNPGQKTDFSSRMTHLPKTALRTAEFWNVLVLEKRLAVGKTQRLWLRGQLSGRALTLW